MLPADAYVRSEMSTADGNDDTQTAASAAMALTRMKWRQTIKQEWVMTKFY
jgi:hypothetical protein